MEEKNLVRLSKLMSEQGIASRRESDRLIEAGLVTVNGEVVDSLGIRVPQDAIIALSSAGTEVVEKQVTILLNKPVGYVSNLPEKGYSPAIELIEPENQFTGGYHKPFDVMHRRRLAVAGRLDIDSKGLLVMTQDGVIAKLLIGENSPIEKEYRVHVEGVITPEKIDQLRFGLALDGKALKRAKVQWTESHLLTFVLREGKKRQIRRMCELVDLEVTGLKRTRIGRIKLDDLPEGQWRYLRPDERFDYAD